jgi:hypothetical protein
VGTVFVEGIGSDAPTTAEQLCSLGYPTALFADSDKPLSPDVETLEASGVKVIQWGGGVATEERIALDLPLEKLSQVVSLAIGMYGQESVIDSICNLLGQSRQQIGEHIDAWLQNGVTESQIRSAVGKAAKSKRWFKRIDTAEDFGKIVAVTLPNISASDTAQKLMLIGSWAYEQ